MQNTKRGCALFLLFNFVSAREKGCGKAFVCHSPVILIGSCLWGIYLYVLLSEICSNLFHACFLSHMKRTTALTMTALHTARSMQAQVIIMLFCKYIACNRQTVILIYHSHINILRTRLTVIAINANALCLLRSKFSNN